MKMLGINLVYWTINKLWGAKMCF